MKIIKYGEPVTEEEIDLINQVFNSAQCPNEVFIDELPGYRTYDEDTKVLYINDPEDGQEYTHEIDL